MAQPHPSERTLISFDWALKRLLRNKANFVILEGFLTELLHQDIQIVNLLESEGNADAEEQKINRVDLLCLNHLQELVIIEVQYHDEVDYFQRILFGASKLITDYLERGAKYGEVRKVYSVHILYFDLGQGSDYVYHGQLAFRGQHEQDILALSKLQRKKYGKMLAGELFPEYYLLKINNFDEVARNTLDEWIYYLKTSTLPKTYRAKGLAEVAEQLKIDDMSPETKAKYLELIKGTNITESMIETAYENGALEGEERGMTKGMVKGEQQQFVTTVLRAFDKGADIAFISEITERTADEVLAILVENNRIKK
jgi:predicted transposase/invertase (TIGR01784 family)